MESKRQNAMYWNRIVRETADKPDHSENRPQFPWAILAKPTSIPVFRSARRPAAAPPNADEEVFGLLSVLADTVYRSVAV